MTSISTSPSPSFWSRAQQALLRVFVGRESALRTIESAWSEAQAEPRIVWCCGPSGIGKSALMQVASARIRARGGRVVLLTEGQMEAPLVAAPAVSELGRDSVPDMLVLDSEGAAAERLQSFFETLLPQAGEHILVLVAALEAPPARIATAFDGILRTLRLRPLSEEEAAEALARRGVAPAQREDIIALAGGIPRAIAELADRARADRPTPINERSPHELAEIIAQNVTRSAPSATHRRALDALSIVPMLDAPLLEVMLVGAGTEPIEGLFTWLGEHSFVVREEQGLALHPRVRDALHRELCMRDPMQRRAMGQAAAQLLVERMHSAPLALGHVLYLDAFFARREVRAPALSTLLRHARKLRTVPSAELPSTSRLRLDASLQALLARATATLCFFGVGRSVDDVELWVELDTHDPTHLVGSLHTAPQAADAPFSAAHLAGTALVLAYAHAHGTALVSLRLPVEFEGELAAFGLALDEASQGTALYLAELDVMGAKGTPALGQNSVVASSAARVAPGRGRVTLAGIGDEERRDSDRDDMTSADTQDGPHLREALRSDASLSDAPRLDPLQLDAKTLGLALRHAFAARFEPHTLRRSTLLGLRTVQRAGGNEEALARTLDILCASLAASPAYASAARVLHVTYLDPSQPKQEAAAVDLGLPFGTYRYQLRRALDLAAQALMQRERVASR